MTSRRRLLECIGLELVVNRRTAAALALKLPRELLARVDELVG